MTADFDQWPQVVRWLLLLLMFIGGSAGSTGGGMKVIRICIVLKHIAREIRWAIVPQSVAHVKIGGEPVDNELVLTVFGFVMLFIGIFALATFAMTLLVPDLETAASAVAATLCNVGPGLSGVGPMQNYAGVPGPGKLLLVLCMLLGRLELFTVVVLMAPRFWKR